jgi:cytochrome c oxidase subunit 1
MFIRAECSSPLQFWRLDLFNQFTTMHGLTAVFGDQYAGVRGFALADSDDDRRARHGVRAYEQLSFLMRCRRQPARRVVLRSGRRARVRLDDVRAAVNANGPGHGPGIFAIHIMGASSIMG